jgi:PAS domain S-box-containing protein
LVNKSNNYTENINDLVITITPDGSIVNATQKWLSILGYINQDLPHLNLIDVIKEDQIPIFFKLIDKVNKNNKTVFIETSFKTKDSQDVYVTGNLEGQFEDGELNSIKCVFQDVTSRKVLEETYGFLMRRIPTPIYIAQNRVIRFVNPSFLDLTKYSENELIGSEPFKIVHKDDREFVKNALDRGERIRKSSNYEYRMITKEGEIRWIMENIISVPFEGGRAFMSTLVDFTELKLGEAALSETKNRYQTLFDSAADSIYIVDMHYKILDANEAACKSLGYSKDDLLKKSWKEMASPKFVRNFDQSLKELIERGERIDEVETVHKDGRLIPIEIHSRIVDYQNKKAILVISRDISDKKRIQILQKRNEARLESMLKIAQSDYGNIQELMEKVLDEIVRITESKIGYIYTYSEDSKEFNIRSWSQYLKKKFDLDNKQIEFSLDKTGLIGETIRQRKPMIINFRQEPNIVKNGYPEGKYQIYKYLSIPIFRSNNIIGIVSVANRDEDYDQFDVIQITTLIDSVWNTLEQKEIEQERTRNTERLKNSEERYRQIIELSQDGILSIDSKGSILSANPAACNIFGYPPGELLGTSILETYLPEDRMATIERLENESFWTNKRFERTAISKNGKIFPIEVSISPLIDKKYQEIVHDISDRKKIENDLKRTRDTFFKVFQLNPAMMTLVSVKDGILLDVNKAFESITGYNRDEIVGRSVFETKLLEDPNQNEHSAEIFNNGYIHNIDVSIITRSGKILEGVNSIEIIDIDGEPTFISVIENVSERNRMLEQLTREKNKLLSITDSLECGLDIVDLDYNVIYQNKFTDKVIGNKIGNKCYRAFFNKDSICADCPVKLAYSDGKTHSILKKEKGLDGKIHTFETTVNCIEDGNGKISSCVEMTRDISESIDAATKLFESEEFNSRLLSNSPNPIICINPDTSVRYINPAFIQLTGYKEEEVIGKKAPYPWYPKDKIEEYTKELKNAMTSGVFRWDRQYKKKNDELLWVKLSISSIEINGNVKFFVGNWDDITENKKMETALKESETKFRKLIENAPVGISIITVTGTIIKANKEMVEMYGNESENEFKKTSVIELCAHPENRKYFLEKLNTEGVVKGFETQMKRKDGTMFWTSISAIKQNDIANDTMIMIVEDITEKVKAKEELIKVNKQLIELDKLKDNFLSTVSHELRTPLTSIKSFAEILLSYEEDRATQKEFLGIINEESDRLTRLINDFLDLSKIQAGRMQWQTANIILTEVVQQVKSSMTPLVDKNQQELIIELEPNLPLVLSDRDKLVQVFTNLLGNALKFTPEGGKIVLKAQIHRNFENTNKDFVEVSIKDTGIGIAPEHHQSIFEKFGQVGDVLKDRPKGTGLGLPICKKFIENYGGKIWVESELGQGSIFIFTLPIVNITDKQESESQKIERKQLLTSITDNQGKTILVVDDEANIRKFINYELSKRGHKIYEASCGKEAVDMARKYHPDLITLDITMPDINGFDVTVVLKNDPETKDIPILIITVIEDEKKAYRLGANDYLTKPISVDNLVSRVNRILGTNGASILVVDDEPSITRSIEFELRKRGYNIQTAGNGKAALETIKINNPSLIILDLIMPEMDGYEVLKHLKGQENTKDIPIIILTAVDIDEGRVKALSLGATEYINKSEGIKKLFETVERISTDLK